MSAALESPIINRPYDMPTRHFQLGSDGPTGTIVDGRRPSESFTPIAKTRKQQPSGSLELDFDLTGERRQRNDLIDQVRQAVDIWRARGYPGATPISRSLLQHWADPERENRVLFCQREAAETAIFLTEVAGRDRAGTDWRRQLDETNAQHNDGLPRMALKMATGAGKTVVMAMLIAWQTLNKAASPRDRRFTRQFLVVAPGITIRDRLGVLQPSHPANYYDERGLIPAHLQGMLSTAQVVTVNYHAFLPRDSRDIKGVSATTRRLLLQGREQDPFRETDDQVVARVLRSFGARASGVMVLNDEAHHCYRDKPIETAGIRLDRKEQTANDEARVWFRGLQAVRERVGVKQIFDLSATPYYLRGSGYSEGYIFPWTVSDFSLMDAIESGIVKVPRMPVDDDALGGDVTYRSLWEHVGQDLPKRTTTIESSSWAPPKALEGALESLYRSYSRAFSDWRERLQSSGEPPPVMIVVCSNTAVSKLVYDWIAGVEDLQGEKHQPGRLELLSNIVGGAPIARPRTILVDSRQLESPEGMRADFRSIAAAEIEAFKEQYVAEHPGADAADVTDEALLREVLNTVGKRGKLGEQVRCVVSVAMLTEGWDANTVTHILGIRAFRSQLLCEQVVGRGLRRRSYAVNAAGFFEPEYANVYGVPFAFIATDHEIGTAEPPPPAIEVGSMRGREEFRIEFPRLEGYRTEVPDGDIVLEVESLERYVVARDEVPDRTVSAPIVGAAEEDHLDVSAVRPQQVAYVLAKQLLETRLLSDGDGMQPWLFPRLVRATRTWVDHAVDLGDGRSIGHLIAVAERRHEAVERLDNALTRMADRRERLRPMLRRYEPVGSTASIYFATRKRVRETRKSEVSHVTLDGIDGNTWEQILALECEANPHVAAYAKNDRLGFSIPYVHAGRSHQYLPDFLLRLAERDGDPVTRTLIVEVSGAQKRHSSPGPTAQKARTARDSWCPAVNNHGGFGRWGYVEISSMHNVTAVLQSAIDDLYSDGPVIGDPDLLDFTRSTSSRANTEGPR